MTADNLNAEPPRCPHCDGRAYGRERDFPPCHAWLKSQGYEPLEVLHWMAGFRDEKVAQGWPEVIDWRGSECRCGNACK